MSISGMLAKILNGIFSGGFANFHVMICNMKMLKKYKDLQLKFLQQLFEIRSLQSDRREETRRIHKFSFAIRTDSASLAKFADLSFRDVNTCPTFR